MAKDNIKSILTAVQFANRVQDARRGRPAFILANPPRELASITDEGKLQFHSMRTLEPDEAEEFGAWLVEVFGG